MILPHEKYVHFFVGPWLLVRQFIEISNQTELNGEVSNFKKHYHEEKKLAFSCLDFTDCIN